MSSWNSSAVHDGKLHTNSRRRQSPTSAVRQSAEDDRSAVSTGQLWSSVFRCCGPVDLEFAARQQGRRNVLKVGRHGTPLPSSPLPSLPLPSPTSSSLSLPLPFPVLTSLSLSPSSPCLPFIPPSSFPLPLPSSPPLPLEVGPLKLARGLGERCKLPQRVRAEPGRQTHFHAFFELKIEASGGINCNDFPGK